MVIGDIFDYPIGMLLEAFAPIDVESSHLHTVQYTDKLYIQFLNGAIYEYDSVPEDLAYAMTRAVSKGKFFWRYIRGQYPYRKVKTIPKLDAVPVGYRFRAPDGDIYLWRGAQWVNTRTGRIATRAVRAKITEIVLRMEAIKNKNKS